MWIDEHPYLFIYLVGCVIVIILTVIKVILFGLIAWISKEHIFNKNARKLDPPDERSFLNKAGDVLTLLFVTVLFSWINVLYIPWEIARVLLASIRELFTSRPEAIEVLRFPLRNNPHMPRESVWAYAHALQIRVGEKQPGETDLRASLDELYGYYPSFDRATALKQLKALNVVSPEVITATMDSLSKPSEEEMEEIGVDDDP